MSKKLFLILAISVGCIAIAVVSFITVRNSQIKGCIVDAINMTENDVADAEYLEDISKRLNYSFVSITKCNKEYKVVVSLTFPDVGAYLKNNSEGFPADVDEIDDFLSDAIYSSDLVSKRFIVNVSKQIGKFMPVFSEDFLDAISGRLYSFSIDYLSNHQ